MKSTVLLMRVAMLDLLADGSGRFSRPDSSQCQESCVERAGSSPGSLNVDRFNKLRNTVREYCEIEKIRKAMRKADPSYASPS